MATRYYLATKSPNALIHGVLDGSWSGLGAFSAPWSPVQWTWRLSQSKVNAGVLRTLANKSNAQGNFDMPLWRVITPPLDAQIINGTIDLCLLLSRVWNGNGIYTNQSHVVYKLHAYITVGQTAAVRQVVLNNYVDPTEWPLALLGGGPGEVWTSLTAPQALIAGNTQAGDCLIVELGCRILSSPTPAPTYPPTEWTEMPIRGTGATAANGTPYADAVPGTNTVNAAPWIEFSMNLTEQAAPAPPPNDACVDAIVVPPALPYESAWIDTTESADTDRAVWWTWTAPSTGKAFFHTLGTNYGTNLTIYKGNCAALVSEFSQRNVNVLSQHRSQSSVMFDAVAGTQYFIRVRSDATSNCAAQSGGLCRLSGSYREVPVDGDLYLPNGAIWALRDGRVVNFNAGFFGTAPTGVGIDYTKRPMDDFNGGQHTGERLLVGLHNFDLVEVLDLPTLSYGDGQFEIDYFDAPWNSPGGIRQHPAQLDISRAGMMYTGWFGNGYLRVRGVGTLPAYLNTVSNNADYSALKIIDATFADFQAGGPFAAAFQYPAIEVTAPWAIALDETSGVLYYTSGGLYEPVGGQIVKRWDTLGNAQLPDFATLALGAGPNPGLKGLAVLPDGGILVCNAPVIQRLGVGGAVLQTYTPSIPEDAQTLIDVVLTPDELSFYALDLQSTRLFKFNIASGVEEATYQPYFEPGSCVQMVLYASTVTPVCPELPAPCPAIGEGAVSSGTLCTAPNPTGCHATDAGG